MVIRQQDDNALLLWCQHSCLWGAWGKITLTFHHMKKGFHHIDMYYRVILSEGETVLNYPQIGSTGFCGNIKWSGAIQHFHLNLLCWRDTRLQLPLTVETVNSLLKWKQNKTTKQNPAWNIFHLCFYPHVFLQVPWDDQSSPNKTTLNLVQWLVIVVAFCLWRIDQIHSLASMPWQDRKAHSSVSGHTYSSER